MCLPSEVLIAGMAAAVVWRVMAPERKTYFAHSSNDAGVWDPLKKHLAEVAGLARIFAAVFGAEDAAYLAGLLHDLGKYGELFQLRLEGKEEGLDHWSIGASVCIERFRSWQAALIVQGHHVGLQWLDSLRGLRPADQERTVNAAGRRLTEPDREVLLQRLAADGLDLPAKIQTDPPRDQQIPAMLDVRMLYSALTDADYLATEQHFDPVAAELRCPAAELNPRHAADVLHTHLQALSAAASASPAVSTLRTDLLPACLSAADSPPGLFTLTAPTGTGKTLSTLAFALRHAAQNGLRRIVVVMPFLSIIDQTVKVYREAPSQLDAAIPLDRYILEHHSLAVEPSGADVEAARLRGLLAQNWDAPIVITTSVQILESLFSNSPAACRKLHRLTDSIIVFDKVQTLPLKLVQPTLAALSHLSARYRTSVVFSTATQPAFPHLHDPVSRLCVNGWRPHEIVSPELRLFERARRVRVQWPTGSGRTSWEDLVSQFEPFHQVLCIVNLKRHALELFRVTKTAWGQAAFHLSTAMCPKHREVVLSEIRARLREGSRCALVATQCVEAGVDLDFPAVFRSLGPLDAIAQAAGRCNRNGLLETGQLTVFLPVDERYPGRTYEQATDVTRMLLNSDPALSIDDPAVFESYFRDLYGIAAMENVKLTEALNATHFPDVRQNYKIIGEKSVNALVPYDLERYNELASRARNQGLDRQWVHDARPHAVSCFPGLVKDVFLEPVPLKNRRNDQNYSGDWFLYPFEKHYDRDTGLQIPSEMELLTS